MAAGVEPVQLDLSAVAFVDSTGVRTLLGLVADASRDGWVLTIVPSEAVRRIVCLLGFEQRLLAAPSLSALRAA